MHKIGHEPCQAFVLASGPTVFNRQILALHSGGYDDAAILFAFDLIEVDGDDWRPKPLEERKAKLAKVLSQPSAGTCRRLCGRLGPMGGLVMAHLRRREFIGLLGGAVAWPLAARAQRSDKLAPRVGVLLYGTPATDPNYGSFRRGLRELGYVEGQTIVLEPRSAESKPERLPLLARELVTAKPDLIYVLGGDVAPFVRSATSTIPIVMAVSNDPVQSGLVASLARPGGNVTGVTFVSSDLAAKRLQFLRELAPQLARVAVLWNPDHVDPEYREIQIAGRTLDVQVQSLEVRSPVDFDRAYQTALSLRAEALMPVSSRLLTLDRVGIIAFAAQHRLLLASGWGPWAREGAILSYGPDLDDITRRSAAHVDKILRGASPAELPVEQPTRFQLVINGKVAKILGLTLPEKLVALADEVIE